MNSVRRSTVRLAVALGFAAVLAACGDGVGELQGLVPSPDPVVDDPPPNNPPALEGTPATTVIAGEPYRFAPQASDPDGDALTFTIDGLPAWATFDGTNGVLSGTPSIADEGDHEQIVITVSDGELTDSLGPFSITVERAIIDPPPNRAPALDGTPPSQILVGEPYLFEPSASDPDGDMLAFTVDALPAWASFDEATGALSGTPATADLGEYPGIVITVSDGDLTDALGPFSITVGRPPVQSDAVTLAVDTANSSVELTYAGIVGADLVSTFGAATFPLSGTLEIEVEYAGEEVLAVTFVALTLDYVVDPANPVSIFVDTDDGGPVVTVEARFPFDETINPGNPVQAFDPQLWVRADGGGDSDIGMQTGTGEALTLEEPRYAFVGTANTFNSPLAPDGFPLQLNPYNRFSRSFDAAPSEPRFLDGIVTIEDCRARFNGAFLGYAVAGGGLLQSALIHEGAFWASAQLPDC